MLDEKIDQMLEKNNRVKKREMAFSISIRITVSTCEMRAHHETSKGVFNLKEEVKYRIIPRYLSPLNRSINETECGKINYLVVLNLVSCLQLNKTENVAILFSVHLQVPEN